MPVLLLNLSFFARHDDFSVLRGADPRSAADASSASLMLQNSPRPKKPARGSRLRTGGSAPHGKNYLRQSRAVLPPAALHSGRYGDRLYRRWGRTFCAAVQPGRDHLLLHLLEFRSAWRHTLG